MLAKNDILDCSCSLVFEMADVSCSDSSIRSVIAALRLRARKRDSSSTWSCLHKYYVEIEMEN